jgi:hypothetical protein
MHPWQHKFGGPSPMAQDDGEKQATTTAKAKAKADSLRE